jgi:hypothetical protein
MDLFRPFLSQGQLLSTFSTSPHRPEAIFSLSFRHLRALTHYYHTTYAGLAESHTISWIHGPLYVAPVILHYERREDREADFLSCIKACLGLFQSHQVVEGIVRAVLGMAVTEGALSMALAKECLDGLRAMRDDRQTFGIPETGFIVDQDLAVESRDAAVGETLAQRFDEMLFLEELNPIEQF